MLSTGYIRVSFRPSISLQKIESKKGETRRCCRSTGFVVPSSFVCLINARIVLSPLLWVGAGREKTTIQRKYKYFVMLFAWTEWLPPCLLLLVVALCLSSIFISGRYIQLETTTGSYILLVGKDLFVWHLEQQPPFLEPGRLFSAYYIRVVK